MPRPVYGHRIIDAVWTPAHNLLIVRCLATGGKYSHRTDRRYQPCNGCMTKVSIEYLRERFVKEGFGS